MGRNFNDAMRVILEPLLAMIRKKADKTEIPKIPHIPTKLSELKEDEDHRTVSDVDIYSWDTKSNFSGSYNDLTNKPSILTPINAADTYLSKTDASSTYLSKTDASSTYLSKTDASKVATSGSFNDLKDKPTIVTNGPNYFITKNVSSANAIGTPVKYDSSRNIIAATTGDCFDGVITAVITGNGNGNGTHYTMIGLGTINAMFKLANSDTITPGMHDFVVSDDPRCIRLATDKDDPSIVRRLRVISQNGSSLYTSI